MSETVTMTITEFLLARTCSADNCDRDGKLTRGMCAKHYRYWLDHTPIGERGPSPRASRRFDDFVDKTGDCWIWTGSTNRKGYGWWTGHGERGLAHRISLGRASSPPSDAPMACHRCDNPPCVNPDHLYWGTARDNARDVMERGGVWNKGRRLDVCGRGHEQSAENVRVAGGRETCRLCDNARSRERQRKIREARRAAL